MESAFPVTSSCSLIHCGSKGVMVVKHLTPLAGAGIQHEMHMCPYSQGAIPVKLRGGTFRSSDPRTIEHNRSHMSRFTSSEYASFVLGCTNGNHRKNNASSCPHLQKILTLRHSAIYTGEFVGGQSKMQNGACLLAVQTSKRNYGTREIYSQLETSSFWGMRSVLTDFAPHVWRRGRSRHKGGNFVRAGFKDTGDAGTGVRNTYKMNLNEYMVTLDKPLGIRFAQTLDGEVYVEALARKGNAENSRMIMVGDVLKKTSAVFGDTMWDVKDFGRTMHAIKNRNGSVSLVLERPVTPIRIQSLTSSAEASFNQGRVGIATWNASMLTADLQAYEDDEWKERSVGFGVFSSKFLRPKGLKALAKFRRRKYENSDHSNGVIVSPSNGHSMAGAANSELSYEVIASFSDEESDGEVKWTHGNFSIEQYTSAIERAENDLCYNHSRGMQYTKITDHIFVGSCIQTHADVHHLARNLGVTSVLNLQCKSEQVNWGIDGEAIEQSFQDEGLVVVSCPIREVDSVDIRRKLPFIVGVLYRLLRKGHRVFVTCTTGLDRSPSCVISYLHWIQDVALQEAIDFIMNLHPCGPDRPAMVWATWDLISMVEKDNHKGPPTHAVQFVWNHGCREGEEVLLVGDFKGGWDEPVKAVHASGPKYTVDLRLPQGRYNYKFIVGGHWRHSNSLPTEVDQWGNVNNVIKIGEVATTSFESPVRPNMKDSNSIKVIERPLTEDERFTLAFASRRMAFSVCPIRLTPKR